MATERHTTVVPPSGISNELDRLRKEAVKTIPGQSGSSGKGSIRATLSNLIILAPALPRKENADSIISSCIESLGKLHPSRFFVIYASNDFQEPLVTEITSRELAVSSAAPVQTEEIHISVHPDSFPIIKNLVLSHLVPDIETICLEISGTGQHPYRTQLLDILKELIDTSISYAPARLLINKEYISGHEHHKSLQYKYICWPLLEKWRMLISEQYDSQEAQKLIEKISDISILFSSDSQDKSAIPEEALTLAAWILSSLKLFPNSLIDTSSDETCIACTSTSKIKKQAHVHFFRTPKEGLANISQVIIEMRLSPESTFETSCLYLPSIQSIEVSSGGKGEVMDSDSSSSGETCEFYFRRCPVQHMTIPEAALQLIRGEKPADIFEEFEKLKSLLG